MTRQPTPDVLGAVLGSVDDAKVIRSQLRYDYSLIPADQRDAVQAAAVEIVQAGRRAQDDLMRIGQRLIEVKEQLEHGQFEEWCATEFQMTARTARNMMNVAKVFGDKTETVSVLSDSAMYLLAAPSTPEEARVEVIEQAQATGKSPTKAEVQETIRKHQPEAVRYIEVWKLEGLAYELSKQWDSDPAMMREGASQQIGSFWNECRVRAAMAGQYRINDLRQAINNVASRMEEMTRRAAEVAKAEAERQQAASKELVTVAQEIDKPLMEWTAEDWARYEAAQQGAAPAGASPAPLRPWWRCLRCGHERQWVIPGTCSKCNGGSWTQIETPIMDHQAAVLTPDRDTRAVATADAAFGMAKAPTRNERIDALLHVFQNAVDALPEVGELTGQYTVTSALLREINKVMAILKTNRIGGYKANE